MNQLDSISNPGLVLAEGDRDQRGEKDSKTENLSEQSRERTNSTDLHVTASLGIESGLTFLGHECSQHCIIPAIGFLKTLIRSLRSEHGDGNENVTNLYI